MRGLADASPCVSSSKHIGEAEAATKGHGSWRGLGRYFSRVPRAMCSRVSALVKHSAAVSSLSIQQRSPLAGRQAHPPNTLPQRPCGPGLHAVAPRRWLALACCPEQA